MGILPSILFLGHIVEMTFIASTSFLHYHRASFCCLLLIADLYTRSVLFNILAKNKRSTYLGRQVEPQMTATKAVLHQQWNLLGQVQCYRVGQVGGLAEVDEVLEGEGQGDGFGKGDGDVLVGLFDVGVLANRDGAVANVARAGEFDTFLGGLDNN